MQESPKTP